MKTSFFSALFAQINQAFKNGVGIWMITQVRFWVPLCVRGGLLRRSTWECASRTAHSRRGFCEIRTPRRVIAPRSRPQRDTAGKLVQSVWRLSRHSHWSGTYQTRIMPCTQPVYAAVGCAQLGCSGWLERIALFWRCSLHGPMSAWEDWPVHPWARSSCYLSRSGSWSGFPLSSY